MGAGDTETRGGSVDGNFAARGRNPHDLADAASGSGSERTLNPAVEPGRNLASSASTAANADSDLRVATADEPRVAGADSVTAPPARPDGTRPPTSEGIQHAPNPTGAAEAPSAVHVRDPAPASHRESPHGTVCRNCGASVSDAFCAACGQSTHLHRSVLAIGHEILHGAFHFEGRIWRTLPELILRPGQLTRRYIQGERAKFISPMALFLFAVFLMFAVFPFTGGALMDDESTEPAAGTPDWQQGARSALDVTEQRIDRLRAEREKPRLTDARRAAIDAEIAELQAARAVMEAMARGDTAGIAVLREDSPGQPPAASALPAQADQPARWRFSWPPPGSRFHRQFEELENNEALLFYKLKTNGYKFSWALVPLSVPFVWLLFFWRRDVHLYDHAVFVTYSIGFMMLFVVLLSLAAAAGVSGAIWGTALVLVPPLHMYRQLRDAYELSRAGAIVRLFLLLIAITIVLIVFVVLLFVLGVLT